MNPLPDEVWSRALPYPEYRESVRRNGEVFDQVYREPAYTAEEVERLIEINDGVVDNFAVVARAYFLGREEDLDAPIGTPHKSLRQTANFAAVGEWDLPETFDLTGVLDLPEGLTLDVENEGGGGNEV